MANLFFFTTSWLLFKGNSKFRHDWMEKVARAIMSITPCAFANPQQSSHRFAVPLSQLLNLAEARTKVISTMLMRLVVSAVILAVACPVDFNYHPHFVRRKKRLSFEAELRKPRKRKKTKGDPRPVMRRETNISHFTKVSASFRQAGND